MIDVEELTELPHRWQTLAADGVGDLDGRSLTEVALAARRMRELADHLEVVTLGALDRAGYTDATYGATTAGWFATHAQVPHHVARGQLKVARLFESDLETTAQAWFEGRITRDHVNAIVDAANPRIRDQVAELQEAIIDAAFVGKRFDVWKAEVAALARELDQDGPEPDDPTITSASWARSDAFAQLQARFGGAHAEVLEQIIEAKTDELFRQQARDAKQFPDLLKLTRNQLRGRAIVALLIESQAVDPDTATPAKTAVHVVIHAYGVDATNDDGDIDWPDPAAMNDATWRITNPDGRRLTSETFAALAGDIEVHPLLVDADDNPIKLGRTTTTTAGDVGEPTLLDLLGHPRLADAKGNPLWLGRSARLAPSNLRRVVLIRDGGCIYPGCDCTVGWADVHHIIFWEDGGTTDIVILVALCRRHHGVAHRKGWSLRPNGDGWFIWRTPSGLRFWSQRHGVQRTDPLPPDTGPP